MNIMNKLTLKHVRKNKARSIVTIIGIIISVAMLTAVTTGLSSGLSWLHEIAMENSGKWHMKFADVDADKYATLAADGKMEEAFAMESIGYGELQNSKNEDKPYIYIEAVTSSTFENMSITLSEGRFPEKDGEIIISEYMAENDAGSYQIGDTITYEIGERYLKDTDDYSIMSENGIEKDVPLDQYDSYLDGKKEYTSWGEDNELKSALATEELRPNGKMVTYTIVGIMEPLSYYMENSNAPGYTAYTYLDITKAAAGEKVNVYFYYKNATTNIYNEAYEDAEFLGITDENSVEGDVTSISGSEINQDVLYYQGISPDKGFNEFLAAVYVIMVIIIMLGSISLIYNAFAISISERSKQLGMLASVGATKRQKRNSVFFEALIYGSIGIPLGILAGITGLTIAFKVVSPMLSSGFEFNNELTMHCSASSILITVILALVTILISAYIPAIRASKIAPIEAIRQTKDIRLVSKKIRTTRVTRKLFGFEGELALKNMKRNKKRYRSIIFSLFISVVLFITVSAYIYYLSDAYISSQSTSNFDMAVRVSDEKYNMDQMAAGIENLTSINSTTYGQSAFLCDEDGYLERFMSDEFRKLLDQEIASGMVTDDMPFAPMFNIYGMDEKSFQEYCEKIGVKEEDISENGMILINQIETKESYSVKSLPILNTQENVKLTLSDGYNNSMTTEVTIDAETLELPVGIVNYGENIYSYILLVTSEGRLNSLINDLSENSKQEYVSSRNIYIEANNRETMQTELEEYLKKSNIPSEKYTLYNYYQDEKSNRQLLYAVSIFAYGFITLISMICCANMCNTISTSIALRRREFAMLKSVGMTPKRFHRMIMFESLLYGIKALAYGLPVGLGISYILYRYVAGRFTVGFLLPAYIYITAVVLVFGVVGTAMFYSSRKVRQENIIDGLKTDIS